MIEKIKKIGLVAIAGLLIPQGSVFAKGDIAAGKVKAVVCAACHGANGKSVNPLWPSLAGQQLQYMIKQLKDFKSGARKDPLMSPQAKALSDEDMENLSAYFNSLK